MTHEEQVKSPLYWNWVKAGLGLKYLKNGIETFVDNEVEILRNTFFHDISRDSGVAVAKCTQCTTANVIPCPTYGICNLRRNAGICSYHGRGNPAKASKTDRNHICNRLYHKITDQHRYNNISWKNTDASQWCTNHWQIAKCFLPVAGYENKMSAAETDCSGLLNIAINCSSVQNGLDACITPPNDVLSKLVQTRNDILHSATLELTEDQLIHYVDQMIAFLQDKKKLLHDQRAQSSIHRLKQLKDGKFIISTKDEIDIRKSALIAIEEKKQEAIEEIESKKREVMDELNNHEKESKTKALQVHLDETSKQLDERSKQLDETSKITETMQVSLLNLNTRQEAVEATLDEFKTSQKHVEAELREKISQLQIDILNCKSQLEVIGKMENSHNLQLNYLSRKHELQRTLCSIYEEHLLTIPVSPLLGEINVGIDDVFVELVICTDEIHEPKVKVDNNVETDSAFKDRSELFREINPQKVKGYRDVFYKNEQRCKNVYVIGDAGMGKSTWCMKLLRTWVSAFKKQEDQSTGKTELNEDENTISEFDVVLFASLRHAASDGNIRDMITHQVFEEHSQLDDLTTEFLKKEPHKCLIILDGLDEWSVPDNSKTCTPLQHPGLPGRKDLHGSTLLTTTRPWKLDAMRLKEKDVDRAVKIQGLENKELLVNRVIELLNKKTKITQNKTYKDFLTDAKVVFKNASSFDFLEFSLLSLDRNNFPSVFNVPLILTYMVCLWFDEGKLESTLSANYSGILELLIANAEGDKASGKLGRLSNLTYLENLKSKWSESGKSFPDCLQSREKCKEYSGLLLKLGDLAFGSLFDLKKENCLVFTTSLLKKSLSDNELEVAVKTGILSQSKVVGKTLSRMTSLSFLHKTIQEYLAALHIVCSTNSGDREAMEKYRSWQKKSEMEDALLFVCGMSPQIASEMSSVVPGFVSQILPLKCIQEIQAAHGDTFPSDDFPIYAPTVTIDPRANEKLLFQQMTLFKTGSKHIDHLTVGTPKRNSNFLLMMTEENNQDIFISEEFEKQLQYADGLTDLELNNIQSTQEDMTWLATALKQMSKLKRLTLCNVSRVKTSGSSQCIDIDMSNCTHLRIFKCKSMSSFSFTLCSIYLKCIELNEVSSCNVTLIPHCMFTNHMETVTCNGGTNCKIKVCAESPIAESQIDNALFERCDSCEFTVQTINTDKVCHIGNISCMHLTNCNVDIGKCVTSNNLFVEHCYKSQLNFQWQHFQHVRHNMVRAMPDITETLIKLLLVSNYKNLKVLRFCNLSTSILEKFLKETVSLFKHLDYLEVSSTSTTGKVIFKSTSAERELKCFGLPVTTWRTLGEILPSLIPLHKVKLKDARNNMDPSIIQSLQSQTHLRYLRCTNISEASWAKLNEVLPNLQQLDTLKLEYSLNKEMSSLDKYPLSPDYWKTLICVLPTLKHLEVLELADFKNKINMPPFEILFVEHLKNLKKLACRGLSTASWRMVGEVLPFLTKLEKLEIMVHTKMSLPPSMMTSLQHLTHLKHLSIQIHHSADDVWRPFQEVLPQLTHIESLELEGNPRGIVKQSIQHLTGLRNVTFCIQDGQRYVHEKLKWFGSIVRNEHKSQWKALEESLQSLKKLEKLELSCNSGHIPRSLILSLEHFSNLRHLSCSILSYENCSELFAIFLKLKHLQILEVQCFCDQLEYTNTLVHMPWIKKITLHLQHKTLNPLYTMYDQQYQTFDSQYLRSYIVTDMIDHLPKTQDTLEVNLIDVIMKSTTVGYIKSLTRFPTQEWKYGKEPSHYTVTLKTQIQGSSPGALSTVAPLCFNSENPYPSLPTKPVKPYCALI